MPGVFEVLGYMGLFLVHDYQINFYDQSPSAVAHSLWANQSGTFFEGYRRPVCL